MKGNRKWLVFVLLFSFILAGVSAYKRQMTGWEQLWMALYLRKKA